MVSGHGAGYLKCTEATKKSNHYRRGMDSGIWHNVGRKVDIGNPYFKRKVIASAFSEILFRSGADNEVTFGLTNRLYAIYMNWKHYNYKLYVLILSGWLIFWLLGGVISGRKKTPKCPSFFLIGCSSFVWYMVLFNHTEIHHAFTYRIFGIGICAFFAIVIESTHTATEKWPGLRRCLAFCVLSLSLLASACVLTLCTKEITPIDKKTATRDEV